MRNQKKDPCMERKESESIKRRENDKETIKMGSKTQRKEGTRGEKERWLGKE